MEDRKTAVEMLHRERITVGARFTRILKARMRFCAALWRAGCGCCGMS